MSIVVRGIGTAVPPAAVTADEGLRIARVLAGPTARESGFLPAVYAGTGNRTRHQVIGRDAMRDLFDGTRHSGSIFLPNGDPRFPGPTTGQRNALYAAEAPTLALRAAVPALKESGFAADTVTHLVTVSCTGFVAPGIDLALVNGLGLRPTVERTHVGFMGCHGALNGLRAANAYASADPAARVLLVAVELCSIHYHYGDDPEKVVANALFADGAAAIVGTAGSDGWAVAATGSCLIPDSADAMGWLIGDHGFEMSLARKASAGGSTDGSARMGCRWKQ
jgi:predicted naringenin-chalcone synthase